MDEKQTEKKIARRGDEARKRGTRTHSMDLGAEKRVVVAADEERRKVVAAQRTAPTAMTWVRLYRLAA